MDELGSVAEVCSPGEAYYDTRPGRGARSLRETHFGAAVRGEVHSAGEDYFDRRLGRGARSVAETHFGAPVRGVGRSAGEDYFDTWPGRGARFAMAHSDAAPWTEARGTRVDPDGFPVMGRKTGQAVLVSSRFDPSTSA